MSCSEIVPSQDGIFQRSTGSTQNIFFCRQPWWWRLSVNTALIFQFRENVSSFNFLANALEVYRVKINKKTENQEINLLRCLGHNLGLCQSLQVGKQSYFLLIIYQEDCVDKIC